MKQVLQRILNYCLSYVPTPLPVGLAELEEFCASIISLAGRYADEDSMKWAIGNMIQHMDQGTAYVPKRVFVRRIRKAAANQVAAAMILQIREKQQVAQAEQAKLQEAQNQAGNTPANAPVEQNS